MSMAERARALLVAQQASARITDVMTCERHLEQVRGRRAHAEQHVSLWDRVVFFHTTPDEARLKDLRAEEKVARKALEDAVAAWRAAVEPCTTFAPVEIVYRVESVTREVLSNRSVGREAKAGRAVAAALDAIADRIVEIWAAGADLVRMAAQLPDDAARRAAAANEPGPAAQHPELGWAPIEGAELYARVAHALETSAEYAAARANFERELREDASFAAALENARAQVTLGDKLAPWKRPRERLVARLEAEVDREQSESAHALDWLRLAVVRAFAAHPLLWLHFALLGAASAIRTARPHRELAVQRSGGAEAVASASARAVVLACLVEVRRACERAFPGVPEQVWPRAQQSVAPDPVVQGPYRSRAPAVQHTNVEEVERSEQLFRAQVDKGATRTLLTHAVTSATLLGFVARHSDALEIAWLDRLAFWSDTPAELLEEQLGQRIEAHERALADHGRRALAEVAAVALEHHPMVGLGQALANSISAVSAIDTHPGRSSTPRSCPTIHKDAAERWLDKLDATLVRFFAVRGHRGPWIDDICRRIRAATGPIAAPRPDELTSYERVVELLAAELQQTDFVALAYHAWQSRGQLSEASRAAEAAAAKVSFWDKVDVFSDTEDEKQRDAWRARAKELRATAASAESQMNLLLDEALALYPPLGLYEGLYLVRAAVADIRAQSQRRTVTHTQRDSKGRVTSTRTETYYVCVLHGKAHAETALERWAERALKVFGPLPTASDALEGWITREL